MTEKIEKKTGISRRQALKVGCLGTTALGLTLCGAAAIRPEPEPILLETYSYGENTMKPRILIAYATYAGSTMEIAGKIGETIATQGYSVAVRPMTDQPDLDDYDAVLLGSAVHHGEWLPEAIEYVRENRSKLEEGPLAIFSVHITNTGDDPQSRRERQAFTDSVRALITSDAEVFLPGRFDRRGAEKMLPGFVARFVPTTNLIKWNKVENWAESVPAELAL